MSTRGNQSARKKYAQDIHEFESFIKAKEVKIQRLIKEIEITKQDIILYKERLLQTQKHYTNLYLK